MADVTNDYYASAAFIGYGAQLLVGQGDSPQTFVAVPEINSIQPGDMTTGVTPVTHLRSPGRHHEKRATIRDSGPITISGNYVPTHGAHKLSGGDGFNATHSLLTLWRSVAENDFQLVMPATATGGIESGEVESPAPEVEVLNIRGTVTRYQIGSFELEEKVTFTAEITPLKDYSDGLPA